LAAYQVQIVCCSVVVVRETTSGPYGIAVGTSEPVSIKQPVWSARTGTIDSNSKQMSVVRGEIMSALATTIAPGAAVALGPTIS
jgi:hypothetical protein